MLLVPVQELLDGDRLAKCVYAPDGRLLLREGSSLNGRLIEVIRRLGQHYVCVEPAGVRTAGAGTDWKRNCRAVTEQLLLQCFQALRRNDGFPAKPLSDWADLVSDIVSAHDRIRIRMSDLSSETDALVAHSLNVVLMALAAARELALRPAEIRDVAIGCLLHDIGLAVPFEERLALHHPQIGYDFVRKIPGFPPLAAQIVLQHHERIDGRGFPGGIQGDAFRLASQLCGIASEFDEYWRQSAGIRPLQEGFLYMMSKMDTYYESDVVHAFLRIFEP